MSAEIVRQIADLQREMEDAHKELSVQFQRIAHMQAQLDKLMATLKPA